MRARAAITGVGVVSAAGAGAAALRAAATSRTRHLQTCALEDGRSFLRSCVDAAALPEVAGGRSLRRAMAQVRFAVAAVAQALDGVPEDAPAAEQRALAFATSMGSVNASRDLWNGVLAQGPLGASPILFSEGVPNAVAGHLSRTFRLLGAGHMLIGGFDAGLHALSVAADLIAAGRAQLAVAGAAEEWCELVARALRRLGAFRGAEPSLAEGAVALRLEPAQAAERAGRRPLATIAATRHTLLAGETRAESDAVARELEGALSSAALDRGAELCIVFADGSARRDVAAARAAGRVAQRWRAHGPATCIAAPWKRRLGDGLSLVSLWNLTAALDDLRPGRALLVFETSAFGALSAVVLRAGGDRDG